MLWTQPNRQLYWALQKIQPWSFFHSLPTQGKRAICAEALYFVLQLNENRRRSIKELDKINLLLLKTGQHLCTYAQFFGINSIIFINHLAI